MPWKITEQDGQHCVVKEGGEVVKCHESKQKAEAHMRALYANTEDSIQEFSMTIVKATSSNGEMRWRSKNSDVGEDYYGERMSVELFRDFISHIEADDPFPAAFKPALCEPDWCGGMPYVSLAHYKTGDKKVNVPGEVRSLYLDGDVLKSTGVMYDTPLGNAVFRSMQNDFVQKRDDRIRISIGFLDLEHSHGDRFTFTRKALGEKCPLCEEGIGDKIYKKGYLVHLALTRVPANPRTDMLLEKSMTTKLEDAKSIVDDEEVIKGLELKSQAEEVLVIKSEEECEDEMKDGKKKKDEEMEEESVSETPEVVASTTDPRGYKEATPVEPSPVEKSVASMLAKFNELKEKGLTGDAALAEMQPAFDDLGNVVKSALTPEPTPQDIVKQDLVNIVRSALQEMLPQLLAQTVAPIQSEVAELRTLSTARQPVIRKEEIPTQRSLNVNLNPQQQVAVNALVEKTKVSQFDQLARQSVGLRD